ncbi:MAG: hypothetical protein QOG89_1820 [Thermomicrobiales bacterium]|nr:hypothetical protein [Thermomicrobiales bacterium]
MASRLALPKTPRFGVDFDPREWLESGRRGLAWRPPRGAELRRALWRGATAPYWLATDVPAPQLPARDKKAPPAGLAGDQVARHVGEIARRVWIQRALTILARSAWLGILVGCLWLLVELRGGPDLDLRLLIWISGIIAVPGVVFAALVRPTRRQVARMLDCSFGLQERMTTAVENLGKGVPKDGERAKLIYLQMADAANVVGDLRRYPIFAIRLPVRELVMAIVCALLFAALFFMRGVGGGIPPVQAGAVPPFTPAAERMAQQPTTSAPTGAQANAPTVKDVQQRAERSNQARQDLSALAKALNDHAVTNAAADAMERGDYPAAADELRDLAEEADKLSPASREELAQDLDNAASQMSEGSQQLADASRQAADGLRQGEQPAQDGMRNLGDAVEKTGGEVASQQELAEQMRQAQAAAANESQSGQASQSDGGEQSGDQSSSDGAQQQSDSQGSQASDGQQGDAGQGADAQPGDGNQPSDSGQNQGDTPSDDPRAAGQQQQGEGGQAGEPGGEQQPGQEGGQPAEGGQPGEAGQQGGQQPGEGAQQGAGAGSGQNDGATESGQTQSTSEGQQAAEGEPADPNVADGNGEGGKGQETEPGADPREAITLARAPEGESIQTSSNNGGSNAGSGPGASVSSGTSTQGEVDAAGPDSNRVPPGYRSIVEDYFSDPDGE